MHDTALRIGGLAIDIYCTVQGARILDLGSMDVNGTLRQFVGPGILYVGVDIEAGPGVDIVVEPGSPLPLEDASFDMVVASSVLEHDPAFWVTFLEMCTKAKAGGYVYFNAPSNGLVHRYPEDHWRFYPDCGKALVRWALSQGIEIELVESFVADRDEDIWNDFVAVFRRLPAGRDLPNRALHEEVACCNVVTHSNPELAKPRNETEDMTLLTSARTALAAKVAESTELEQRLGQLRDEIAEAAQQKAGLEDENRSVAAQRDAATAAFQDAEARAAAHRTERLALETRLGELDTELAQLAEREKASLQRLADSEDWVFKLSEERAALQAELRRLRQKSSRSERQLERLKADIAQAKMEEDVTAKALAAAEVSKVKLEHEFKALAGEHAALEAKTAALAAELTQSRDDGQLTQARLQERNREVGALSLRIVTAQREAAKHGADADWHMKVSSLLTDPQPWWWSLLPRAKRQARLDRRLVRHGLFDAQAYLRRYPDVRSSGLSAICHYIRHGRAEGRTWE